MFAANLSPFISRPVFIAEALTDSLQLDAHCQLPPPEQWGREALAYIAEFGDNMTKALFAVPALSKNVAETINPNRIVSFLAVRPSSRDKWKYCLKLKFFILSQVII